ncbi:MAG: hypothetical protein LH471_02455 [Salinibacterium sp.]|nr:hypothetical protein [Salinibacterium sp.]
MGLALGGIYRRCVSDVGAGPGVSYRNAHVVTGKEALGWSAVWATLGLSFACTLTKHRTAAVTSTVLTRAVRGRPARGVIFHSDRGSEPEFNRSSQQY